ncbi:MAG: amino acid/amide transporter substrate-binding protein family [Massilia sp.]|jgi:branched-chain amino acid transport system substrate-binding protein|nr:amino acid/amide transporter substrate-binding protein family [Massilia sp.]MDB5952178.1 amino acid/amide transporter substrate-binding protein family [Massilia sp.]
MTEHKIGKKFFALAAGAVFVTSMSTAALGAEPIKIATIIELTGTGATAGTNFKNGMDLAIKEINAGGGVLGHKITAITMDTQSNPGIAKGLTAKAIDEEVFAVFGPVISGSIIVSMTETRRAGIPNFTGAEAASITQQGNPYVFRTSFTQASSMPKVARYVTTAKIGALAIIYVNNDFGKGGRDMLVKALEKSATKVVADISTDPGQIDFAAAVLKAKQANPDAIFVYTNEEESARALRELRKQGWTKPILGESTLIGQKVIDLAGDSANGVIAHVGLTVDAPNPPVRAFRAKFEKEYKYVSDHNGMKGYSGIFALKAAIEKVGKLDRKAAAAALHGMKINTAQHPGVLMDVAYDEKGDIERESFIMQVKNGKQEVLSVLPAVSKQ